MPGQVPVRWKCRIEVGIVREERMAVPGAGSVHGPVVGTTGAHRRTEPGELLRQSVDAGSGLGSGRRADSLPLRIGGVEGRERV